MANYGALCILTGGPTFTIKAGGKKFFFEWNHHAGPTVLVRRTWEPTINQPPENSPFWDAVDWWNKQGRRIADGLCVWNRQSDAQFEMEHLGGRSYFAGKLLRGECFELT